jgi:hypothetical protein
MKRAFTEVFKYLQALPTASYCVEETNSNNKYKEIEIKVDGQIRTARCRKQRDLENGKAIAFALQRVEFVISVIGGRYLEMTS